MDVIKVELSVEKESYELGKGLAKVIKGIQEMSKDGLNADDIPKAIALLVDGELKDAALGIDKIQAALKENKAAVVAAVVVAAIKALE